MRALCAGLVTQLPPGLRVALLEYMAHLSMKDWEALGNDFVKLQFVTEDSSNPNEVPGLMDSVGALMEVLMAGGGAVNLSPDKTRELVDMVGLDPADLEDGGFMEGFATVMDNLSNPSAVVRSSSSHHDRTLGGGARAADLGAAFTDSAAAWFAVSCVQCATCLWRGVSTPSMP